MSSDWIAAVALGIQIFGPLLDPTPVSTSPSIVPSSASGAQVGDLITLNVEVTDSTGREIANTWRRGLPLTVEIGAAPLSQAFTSALIGLEVGQNRKIGPLRTGLWGDANADSVTVRFQVLNLTPANQRSDTLARQGGS